MLIGQFLNMNFITFDLDGASACSIFMLEMNEYVRSNIIVRKQKNGSKMATISKSLRIYFESTLSFSIS